MEKYVSPIEFGDSYVDKKNDMYVLKFYDNSYDGSIVRIGCKEAEEYCKMGVRLSMDNTKQHFKTFGYFLSGIELNGFLLGGTYDKSGNITERLIIKTRDRADYALLQERYARLLKKINNRGCIYRWYSDRLGRTSSINTPDGKSIGLVPDGIEFSLELADDVINLVIDEGISVGRVKKRK